MMKPAKPKAVIYGRTRRGRLQRISRAIIAKGSSMLYRIDRLVPIKGKTMRTVKGIAIGSIAAIFAVALMWPRGGALLWAQTGNPLIAPVPPPAAPAQLPAPVTTAIAPVLATVAPIPTATPTPAERVFNCTCSGAKKTAVIRRQNNAKVAFESQEMCAVMRNVQLSGVYCIRSLLYQAYPRAGKRRTETCTHRSPFVAFRIHDTRTERFA